MHSIATTIVEDPNLLAASRIKEGALVAAVLIAKPQVVFVGGFEIQATGIIRARLLRSNAKRDAPIFAPAGN